mmetsp:Transcript_96590/g.297803  ORF Transcript_96590/g.297803 Transcript_96590/m.297803 type:complete len:325 (+) Transcript_96590:65-1039(+)
MSVEAFQGHTVLRQLEVHHGGFHKGWRDPHVRARGSHGAILEEKRQDGRHRQAAVGDLGVQPPGLLFRVGDRAAVRETQDAGVGIVAGDAGGVVLEVDALNEANEEDKLQNPHQRDLGDGRQAVGHVRELEALRRGEEAGEAVALGDHVPDGRQHRHAAMLQLRHPAPPEGRLVAVRGEARGVPEPRRGLHPELLLEGVRRQPHLRAGRPHSAVLEEHAQNRNHGQAAVGNLSIELLLADLWVSNGWGVDDAVRPKLVIVRPVLNRREADNEAGGKLPRRQLWVLVGSEQLHGQAKEDDLLPPNGRDLRQSSQAVGDIRELEAD